MSWHARGTTCTRRRAGSTALLLLLIQALAGCRPAAGSGTKVRIASKAFTESVILGEVAILLAGEGGLAVKPARSLGGTRVLWDALQRGEVDVYPEYTGTVIYEILPEGERPPPGDGQLDGLRRSLRARGVGMIGPLGFDDSYALGMREELAGKLAITRISDLVRAPELRFGFSNEFMSRKDGWPQLQARYGLRAVRANGMDHDLAYRALQSGGIDVTDVYSTDAEIAYYRLRVLQDDLGVFPRYHAVYLYRLARARELAPLCARLSELRIDAAHMRRANARAKLERVPETEVASELLPASARARTQAAGATHRVRYDEILARASEHLTLVAISLVLAIAVAVPLGVLCERRRRLGRLVLDVVGVVQTIPSLALLVFMIPLFGIGALPATVALFLYGLLPIVRNTYAGLCDVPEELRHVADALGLPPMARLRVLELPLASRAILAGIKSAAVINVGTATLGALIGAGGLGQPILTGIRLDDVGLILEGAVPASLLAIAVERAFGLLERLLQPKSSSG